MVELGTSPLDEIELRLDASRVTDGKDFVAELEGDAEGTDETSRNPSR